MCGIIAYNGSKDVLPILIDGLKRLEYRGYDSAGVAIFDRSKIAITKKKGKVSILESSLENSAENTIGIGHTRWATHGVPNDVNAHPHLSADGSIALVHNGIIENYQELKDALVDLGYEFKSDTDTEVLSHLIQELRDSRVLSFTNAVKEALKQVVGAYALVIMDVNNPSMLIGARKSSPLALGIGDGDLYLASDASPIIQYTDQYIFLEDEQIVEVYDNGSYKISNLDDSEAKPVITKLDLKIEELEKGGYDHFMLKEIFQQPKTIADSMRGRLNVESGTIRVGGLTDHLDRIKNIKRLILTACGTSWHTALIAEYLFEELARLPTEVEYASEFRYRNPIIDKNDLVIFVSQSGETADTLAALQLSKSLGAMTYGVVNVVGSSIARETDTGSYIHGGPEIGVASTKAFTGQLVVLTLMAAQLGRERGTLKDDKYLSIVNGLQKLPNQVEQILKAAEKIKNIALEIKSANNALYLGRGYNFPVALEGALKLKEISYIHAEGYPAAEMKHGPIALIDMYMPVIVIATNVSAYEKIISNIEEVKARKGVVIAIINENDEIIRNLADYWIAIPDTDECLTPILSVVPLQLLAYYIAVMRGCNVDQPRNLAKSVTVE